VKIPAAPLVSLRQCRNFPRAAGRISAGFFQSYRVLKKFKPQVLLGLGGYVSAAPLGAGLCLGIPLVLHEQNRVPGRVTLFFSRFAKGIALGFPPARELAPKERAVITGNPLSARVKKSAPPEVVSAWGLEKERFTVLVMGGSRGAHFINGLFIEMAPLWEKAGDGIQFIHLSGKEDESAVREAYRSFSLHARVISFLDEIGWAYSQADLLVSRGGAATLTEAAYWGLPALIIPYPHSARGHQSANARYFEANGAALVFEQERCPAKAAADAILSLKQDRERLQKMSAKARALFLPKAEESILRLIEEAIGENARGGSGGGK
jgi:UDP-N-acetylglucosamine--N-acetylmuramyl-(pentapeptide) pyrophosphoryl-undecaprenol N-acetylglucosamine transferase